MFAAHLGFTQLDKYDEGRFKLATGIDDEPGDYMVEVFGFNLPFELLR
jgi:hypothetical protein